MKFSNSIEEFFMLCISHEITKNMHNIKRLQNNNLKKSRIFGEKSTLKAQLKDTEISDNNKTSNYSDKVKEQVQSCCTSRCRTGAQQVRDYVLVTGAWYCTFRRI